MHSSLESRLGGLGSRLEPTSMQKTRAQQAHAGLRDRLQTAMMRKRVRHTYLSGSYVRSTALRSLEDVDVIAEIEPEEWDRGFWRSLFDQPPFAGDLLKTLAAALRRRERRTMGDRSARVRQQRVSVGVVRPALTIDVVPAIVHPRHSDWLRIPSRRTGDWIDTAPKIHAAVTAELNAKHDGRFVPLVKIAKAWNQAAASTIRLKGFSIEVMVAHLFTRCKLESLEQGLWLFCDFLSHFGGGSRRDWRRMRLPIDLNRTDPFVADTARTRGNVLAGVDAARTNKFIARAVKTRDALERARQARTAADGWTALEPLFASRRKRRGAARHRSRRGVS